MTTRLPNQTIARPASPGPQERTHPQRNPSTQPQSYSNPSTNPQATSSASNSVPVRDSCDNRLRGASGHEKFPSWPVPAAQEAPQVLRGPPSGGSHRSKSWTDHTSYPKEKTMTYTRPYMKKQHVYGKQLKTVMERCEKLPPEAFESHPQPEHLIAQNRLHYTLAERDTPNPLELDSPKPQAQTIDFKYRQNHQLTQADLEEYTRNYEEPLNHHQKQSSYAQSEGYHSYVSSSDSTTPFLDRLRRDSEASRPARLWDEGLEGRDSVVTTSSGSGSSSETLKWHGSMSDVSVASSGPTNHSRQLIAHSARVQTPQRHHSESVLYMGTERHEWRDREHRNNHHNQRKLFPVNTYTVQPNSDPGNTQRLISLSSQTSLSVADRINELERQQTKYTYLDPGKTHKVSDPTLKAIQKKALLSFYERHHSTKSSWRSEPQLAQSAVPQAPQPPPRPQQQQSPSRRASCASDYASNQRKPRDKQETLNQHSNSCSSLSSDLLGPVIMGPAISVDDWVPERPPKNPLLRSTYPDLFQESRIPSPELPPPSPPIVELDELIDLSDEPLPPPPSDLETSNWTQNDPHKLPSRPHPQNNPVVSQSSVCKLPKQQPPKDYRGKVPGTPENWDINDPNASLEKFSGRTHPQNGQTQVFKVPKQLSISIPVDYNRGKSTMSLVSQPSDPEPHSWDQNDSLRLNEKFPTRNLLQSCPTVSQTPIIKVPMKATHGDYRVKPSDPEISNWEQNDRKGVPQKVFDRNPIQNGQVALQKPVFKVPVKTSSDYKGRTSSGEAGEVGGPPPLHPRQMRVNQSMRARIPDNSRRNSGSYRGSPQKCDEKLEIQGPANMSQSKASYLASRRDREHGLPNSDIGSYKRTMSPSGQTLQTDSDNPRLRENGWTISRQSNSTLIRNTSNLLRRSSLVETKSTKPEVKKPLCNLPDVLPINAKVTTSRSQFARSLSEDKTNDRLSLNLSYQPNPPKIMQPTAQKSPKTSPSNSPKISQYAFDPKPQFNYTETYRQSRTHEEIYQKLIPKEQTEEGPQKFQRSDNPEVYRRSQSVNYLPDSSQKLRDQTEDVYKRPQKKELSPTEEIYRRSSPRRSPRLRDSGEQTELQRISPRSSLGRFSPPKLCQVASLKIQRANNEASEDPVGQPKVIEGLQLIQRTEVTLRVNTCTIDAASQTEKEEMLATPLPVRKKLQEEIDCEKLSQDLASQLSPSDKLKTILVPGPDHKKPTDYVTGLFKIEVTSKPRPHNSPFRSRNNTPNSSPPPSISLSSTTSQTDSSSVAKSTSEITIPVLEPTSPLSATSTYFTTSESKAKFLTRYSHDMSQYNVLTDTKDLNQKKEELVNRLDRKLEVLRTEQLVVSEECKLNDELGENVERHVSRVARPHEAAKFRLHVEEVGKITSLLLGLSGRLARVENALMGLSSDHSEKKILESKRDKLQEQLGEAKKLKENIDKRSVSVSNILYKYLNSEEYADYDHFINMKAKLIMDSREISDKIKLGEEQLLALKETLAIGAVRD